MNLSIIVAAANYNVIGKNNKLIWHLPADLKHFKDITMGKSIIMGRKTYESIGKPLPGRKNIVLTNDPSYKAEGCVAINSFEQLSTAIDSNEEAFIIGGENIYRQFIGVANKIYLTRVYDNFEGDTFFPDIDEEIWQTVEKTDYKADEKNKHDFAFITLVRK